MVAKEEKKMHNSNFFDAEMLATKFDKKRKKREKKKKRKNAKF